MKTFPEYTILVCSLSAVINTISKRNWKWEEARAVAQGRNLEAGINVKQWRNTACWLALRSLFKLLPFTTQTQQRDPLRDIDSLASIISQENAPKVLPTAQSDGGNPSSLYSFFPQVGNN